MLRPMSTGDRLRLQKQVKSLIRRGQIHINIEAVDIQLGSRPGPQWRYPDEAFLGNEDSCLRLLKRVGDRRLCREDKLGLAALARSPDFPLRIGSTIFELPWTRNSTLGRFGRKSSRRAFRLSAIPINAAQTSSMDDLFLLSSDVFALLKMSFSPLLIRQNLAPSDVSRSPPQINSTCGLIRMPVLATSLLPPVQASQGPKAIGRCTLMCGASGSGKTYTAMLHAAAGQLREGMGCVYLDVRRLKDSRGVRLAQILEELGRGFDAAFSISNCTLILDDLDELSLVDDEYGAPTEKEHMMQPNPALVDQCHAIEGMLQHIMAGIDAAGYDTRFIVTCKDAKKLSPRVQSMFGFDDVIHLPLLSRKDRATFFSVCLNMLQHSARPVGNSSDHAFIGTPEFGSKTAGFRPRDLELLASQARQLLKTTVVPPLSVRDAVMNAIQKYVPLSELSASSELSSAAYDFSEVGGLFKVKRELTTTVLRPAQYQRIYSKSKNKLPKGILLFGLPGTKIRNKLFRTSGVIAICTSAHYLLLIDLDSLPGCGKSFIVPALARECGYPLIRCRGPEVLDKYIGASEMKVRELFTRAASVAPSIVWFDELDSLAPIRGSDSTGVTDRVVNQLLTFLDGVEESSGSIYVVASTSRPDKIDPALLRPGRLEKHVYVGLPENNDEWTDLVLKTAQCYNLSQDALDHIVSGQLSERFSLEWGKEFHLSAADIRSVFNSAQLAAAHEFLDQTQAGKCPKEIDGAVQMQLRHLLSAFDSSKSSLTTVDRTMLMNIYSKFQKGERNDEVSMKVALK